MRKNTRRRIYFVASSLLWAILLFSTTMAVLNWNEMKGGLHGRYVIIYSQTDTIIHKVGPTGLEAIGNLLNYPHTVLKMLK